MIEKIISGGQTGADRAALDVAIKLGLPHGGWIPKGRKAEDGTLPDIYQLQEMPTDSYPKRTEQNVIDSDGTLIISHGSLTGGSAYTRKMAMKHSKPWFHTDLNKMPTFKAAILIEDWISKNRIETLNVAGPRASKDPLIYGLVTVILELVYNLEIAKNDRPGPPHEVIKTDRLEIIDLPKKVLEIADQIIDDLSLKDRVTMANLEDDQIEFINALMTHYIQNNLDELSIKMEETDLIEPEAIVKEVWNRLKETHKLRVVK
jgi:hypothetical protein